MSQVAAAFDPDQEKKQLIENAQKMLSKARELGATACEVGSSCDTGLSVTVRMGDVETIEFNKDQGVGVTVYFGNRKGSASTTDISNDALISAVQAACDIARYTSEDECNGLADKSLMATEDIELGLYHPWPVDTSQAVAMATACEQAALSASDKIINSDGASVSTYAGCSLYANSNGFTGTRKSTRHSLSCCVIGRDLKSDEMQRDYWYSVARDAGLLEKAENVGKIAAHRTLSRLGPQKLNTMKTPVIFSAEIASGLIGHLLAAASGNNIYRDSSFLINHLNKQICPQWVRIHEQPHLVGGLASSAYDRDGLQTHAKNFVNNGVLETYLLSAYSARKLKMQSTANAGGAHNVFMKANAGSLNDLIKSMDKGVLLTELFGHGTNLVTGDYSHGASGFWVENGEIQYPVSEITVAGNLKDIFQNIELAGNDIDTRRSIQTGSLLIDGLAIAGN